MNHEYQRALPRVEDADSGSVDSIQGMLRDADMIPYIELLTAIAEQPEPPCTQCDHKTFCSRAMPDGRYWACESFLSYTKPSLKSIEINKANQIPSAIWGKAVFTDVPLKTIHREQRAIEIKSQEKDNESE